MSLGDFNFGSFDFSFRGGEGPTTGPVGGLGGILSPAGLAGLQGAFFEAGAGGGGTVRIGVPTLSIEQQVQQEIEQARQEESTIVPQFPPGHPEGPQGPQTQRGGFPEFPVVLDIPGAGGGGEVVFDPPPPRRGTNVPTPPEEVPQDCIPIPRLPDVCFRLGVNLNLNLVQRLALMLNVSPQVLLNLVGFQSGAPVGVGRRTQPPHSGPGFVTMPAGCPGFFEQSFPRPKVTVVCRCGAGCGGCNCGA